MSFSVHFNGRFFVASLHKTWHLCVSTIVCLIRTEHLSRALLCSWRSDRNHYQGQERCYPFHRVHQGNRCVITGSDFSTEGRAPSTKNPRTSASRGMSTARFWRRSTSWKSTSAFCPTLSLGWLLLLDECKRRASWSQSGWENVTLLEENGTLEDKFFIICPCLRSRLTDPFFFSKKEGTKEITSSRGFARSGTYRA